MLHCARICSIVLYFIVDPGFAAVSLVCFNDVGKSMQNCKIYDASKAVKYRIVLSYLYGEEENEDN